jgi:hypothetical protein
MEIFHFSKSSSCDITEIIDAQVHGLNTSANWFCPWIYDPGKWLLSAALHEQLTRGEYTCHF